ncbi:hypothetical protein HCU64_22035 [Methylobacterium sp. C25]|uniref:hypothetical protein n=1 Tax=Methylobacterium sp. C25 TaxID=2721622 RepID=UPI001F23CC6B|nr:hypothetical protein [Methylobacterium sp. C25]MCE4226431.1 hypothetical protein [Methylobacterium sp. C25]
MKSTAPLIAADSSAAEGDQALTVRLKASFEEALENSCEGTTFRLRVLLEMVVIELGKLEKRQRINKN